MLEPVHLWSYIVIAPTAVAALIALLGSIGRDRVPNYVYATLSTVVLALTLLPPLSYVMRTGVKVCESTVISLPLIGRVSLWLNPCSAVYALVTSIVLTAVSVYSLPYMEHRLEELGAGRNLSLYYVLYLLYGVGLLGIVYSSNLILTFVFLELSVVTSFLLIMLYGYGERLKISLLYFIWSQVGSLLFLCGVILLMLNKSVGSAYMFDLLRDQGVTTASLAYFLILAGCLIKMGTLIVHFWLPWAHAEAPSPVSAVLSPVHIGLMSYVLIEVTHTVLRPLLLETSLPLVAYGIATMIYGATMALAERDVKRFLAYSSISHMGALLICVALPSSVGEIAAVLVFTAHALAKAVLFMESGYLIYRVGVRDITMLGGLYTIMVSSSLISLIALITLSGVFNIGLISKIFLTRALVSIVSSRLSLGEEIMYLVPYFASLILTVAYCFYLAKRVFFGQTTVTRYLPYTVLTMEAPMALLAVLSIVLMVPQVLSPLTHKLTLWSFVRA